MPSFRASAIPLCTCALFASITLTGCATSGLSAQMPPGERLAGDWKLDLARSDDLGKAVAELRAQGAKGRRGSGAGSGSGSGQPGSGHPRHRRTGGGAGSPGGAGGPGVPGGQPDEQGPQVESPPGSDSGVAGAGAGFAPHASPVDELMSSLPRGDYLRITVSPGAFTVISGDSNDEYTPGLQSEISAVQGDAQQISGWKGADYVIDTRPQWGAEIIQSYTLTKDGRLAMTVRLTGGRTNFRFTRVYDRTTRVAPLAPPTNN